MRSASLPLKSTAVKSYEGRYPLESQRTNNHVSTSFLVVIDGLGYFPAHNGELVSNVFDVEW